MQRREARPPSSVVRRLALWHDFDLTLWLHLALALVLTLKMSNYLPRQPVTRTSTQRLTTFALAIVNYNVNKKGGSAWKCACALPFAHACQHVKGHTTSFKKQQCLKLFQPMMTLRMQSRSDFWRQTTLSASGRKNSAQMA